MGGSPQPSEGTMAPMGGSPQPSEGTMAATGGSPQPSEGTMAPMGGSPQPNAVSMAPVGNSGSAATFIPAPRDTENATIPMWAWLICATLVLLFGPRVGGTSLPPQKAQGPSFSLLSYELEAGEAQTA